MTEISIGINPSCMSPIALFLSIKAMSIIIIIDRNKFFDGKEIVSWKNRFPFSFSIHRSAHLHSFQLAVNGFEKKKEKIVLEWKCVQMHRRQWEQKMKKKNKWRTDIETRITSCVPCVCRWLLSSEYIRFPFATRELNARCGNKIKMASEMQRQEEKERKEIGPTCLCVMCPCTAHVIYGVCLCVHERNVALVPACAPCMRVYDENHLIWMFGINS